MMRGYFFPIDWQKRAQVPRHRRSRFWHRFAARIVARALMNDDSEYVMRVQTGNGSHARITVSAPCLAAHVLQTVADYDVAPSDVHGRFEALQWRRGPLRRLVDRVRNLFSRRGRCVSHCCAQDVEYSVAIGGCSMQTEPAKPVQVNIQVN